MDDLEAKLRTLRLREPSPDLDDRVRAQKPERPPSPEFASTRVSIWVAAAAALVMAVAGFAVGAAWRGEPAVVIRQGPPPPVAVQVIYNSPSSGNPFDFTLASDIFPPGEMTTSIQTQKGTGT